eukprot:365052-Chlamydomonas_euryale.AAC.33
MFGLNAHPKTFWTISGIASRSILRMQVTRHGMRVMTCDFRDADFISLDPTSRAIQSLRLL